jgi:hypothetical protein
VSGGKGRKPLVRGKEGWGRNRKEGGEWRIERRWRAMDRDVSLATERSWSSG